DAIARIVAAENDAPWLHRTEDDFVLERGDEVARRTLEKRHERRAVRVRFWLARRIGALRPLLRRCTGNCAHVSARFGRQRAGARKPLADTARAGIIGRRRETQIAEFLS